MLQYIIRRLLIASLTLLMITFVIFGLVRSMPGTPLTVQSAVADPARGIKKEDRARLEKIYHLDKPWYEAYGLWLRNVMQFNFGDSISRKQPVSRLIRERVFATLVLSVSSLILTYVFSIPLGLWTTVRAGTTRERTTSTLLYMLYSFPAFVAALYLQLLFAIRLGWLPLMGMVGDEYDSLALPEKTWDIFLHALMPILCFTYGSLAYYTRFVKSNMMEVIRQDYIRTAKAKGVAPRDIIVHHAFRNTLIPMVTLIGLTLPSLLGGAIILEQIFSWPGMGNLFFNSILERDYPTIMGLVLMFSILTLAGQLLADILYCFVDPRVSYH